MQVSNNPFMLIFGAFQIVLSQIPDFDRLWFLSILAAVMSFGYSTIGLGLAIGKTTGTHACTDTFDITCLLTSRVLLCVQLL